MAQGLASGDIAGITGTLAPVHEDYAALREALASTPEEDVEKRRMIRANMDRWRWLPRDLGGQYLLTNVPEYQLRLMVNGQIIRTYRTIVGKPGRTATPQLAETVEGVVFNPTWTVPQSIVVGEGLGEPRAEQSHMGAQQRLSRHARGRRLYQRGAAAGAGQFAGHDEARHAQPARDLPARHACAQPVRQRGSRAQPRLYPRGASAGTGDDHGDPWRRCIA